MSAPTFSSLTAAERAAALLDDGTLARLSISAAAKSTVWIGAGMLSHRPVLIALTDGHRRGGTVGAREAGILTELTAAASHQDLAAVIVCWDTGGVRVDEGPLALATASAVGVALAHLALTGPPVLTVVSGPRGCFGAPSVIAALSSLIVLTEDAHWGLTGPKLLHTGLAATAELASTREAAAWEATSAPQRRRAGLADVVVPDSAQQIRRELGGFVSKARRRPSLVRVVDSSAARTARLAGRLRRERSATEPSGPGPHQARRQRDLLRFSFRGHWRPTAPILRQGLVHAAWGQLDKRPALGMIVGSERHREPGMGIEDANAITEMIRFAVHESTNERAPILTFLFCQGHAVDLQEERAGLHSALAETLKSMTAARLLGHPLLCVLGGAAYGAAYLSLAAPSHRVLAIRGTTVAPMAPHVLAAFRRLRGMRHAADTPRDLAEHIPEIRMVESIIRLPRVLREELDSLQREMHLGAAAGQP